MKPEIKESIIKIINQNNIVSECTSRSYSLCVQTYTEEVVPETKKQKFERQVRKALRMRTKPQKTRTVTNTPVVCKYWEFVNPANGNDCMELSIMVDGKVIEKRTIGKQDDLTNAAPGLRDVMDIHDAAKVAHHEQHRNGHGPVYTPSELRQKAFLESVLSKQK